MNNTGNNHFFIIGAQRCGTTYLYQVLADHPEITMAEPVRPEPKYFLSERVENENPEQYIEEYFTDASKYSMLGEKSTSYIESKEALVKIKQWFPNSKILVMLRNPVHRALSNFWFSKMHGIETRSVEEAFLRNVPSPKIPDHISVNPFDYLKRGEYTRYLNSLYSIFSKEQVWVGFSETLTGSKTEIERLYDWLGVGKDHSPAQLNEVVNAAPQKAEVSEEVIERLKTHFQSHNRELRELLQQELPFE